MDTGFTTKLPKAPPGNGGTTPVEIGNENKRHGGATASREDGADKTMVEFIDMATSSAKSCEELEVDVYLREAQALRDKLSKNITEVNIEQHALALQLSQESMANDELVASRLADLLDCYSNIQISPTQQIGNRLVSLYSQAQSAACVKAMLERVEQEADDQRRIETERDV